MNPDDAYSFDSTYYQEVVRAAREYKTTYNFKSNTDEYKRLINMIAPPSSDMATRRYVERGMIDDFSIKVTPDAETPTTPDEPYDNANVIRDIDYSNFTEEELNSAIDHLHEVLLKKRHESLLDLDLTINKDDQ